MTLKEINKRAEELDKSNPLSIDEILKIDMIDHKQRLFDQAKRELQAEKEGVIITQEVNWLHNRLLEEGIYSHPNTQHDFLVTGKGSYYGETERYFFKYVDTFTFKEVRIFKKSKRVTVSSKRTNSKEGAKK